VKKPGILAQVQVETPSINTAFLIRIYNLEQSDSRGRQTLGALRKESLSSLQVFLGYVLFLL